MTDEEVLIEKTFRQYADAFQTLKPGKIISFIHCPAILISPRKIAVIRNSVIGYFVFDRVMKDLKLRCFRGSITKSLKVQQLDDNLAIVTGLVIRYKQCQNNEPKTVLECFNLTYTMRKINHAWKIIVGVLTETECPSEDCRTS